MDSLTAFLTIYLNSQTLNLRVSNLLAGLQDLLAGLLNSAAGISDSDFLCMVPKVIDLFGAAALSLQLITEKNFNGALGTADQIALGQLFSFFLGSGPDRGQSPVE